MSLRRTPRDLREIFRSIDLVFFGRACEHAGVSVRWRRFRPTKDRFHFGEYESEKKEVRINFRLSEWDVPDYVVVGVCYHEMLHATIGLEHDVRFAEHEHKYPHYYRSEKWCDDFVLAMED